MSDDSVRKTHQLFDESAGVWFDIYEAPGIEGDMVVAEVPREDQHPSTVRRRLLSKGAAAAALTDADLQAAVATEAPVVRRAGRTGWRDSSRRFVSHRHVAGASEAGTVLPPVCASGAVGGLTCQGDLEGWQDLARVATHSTAMTVALCAAFAAPLLARVHRPNFGIVLVGPSRCGKSTAQLLGASVLGFGREEDLPSLNATHSGLIAAALGFNDHLLPINEVGTARGAKRDIYLVLRETTYALMNGQDVLRHPAWTGVSGGTGTFQVLCLLSSEHSPDAWAARHGETRDEGETARLIGLPVLHPNSATVFDRPPKGLSGGALVAWETEQFRRLRHGLPRHSGVALPTFLDALVRNRRGTSRRARAAIKRFERKMVKAGMTAVARDIVAKFGVLLAGGLLAMKAGVLPLEKRVLARAIQRACWAALAAIPNPGAELRADLALLKERLASGAIIDIEACTRQQLRLMRDADGFRRPRSGGEEFVVRAQVFAEWFGIAARAQRVLEWLDEEGLLQHSRERTRGRSIAWAQKQVTWPDESRPRSISLYLPAGLDDLDRIT